MNLSLPEQRLRMGKAQSFGTEPVTVSPEFDPLAEYRDQAERVEMQGDKFSQRELHQAVAKIINRFKLT